MAVLSDDEIRDRLQAHADWDFRNDALHRGFELPRFMEVVRLVNDVAGPAEESDHHPDMTINHRRITFALPTHNQGGVTEKDFALLEAIEVADATSLPEG